MTTLQEDDDIEINPFTMLLLNSPDDQQESSHSKSPPPTDQQHQSYYISSIKSTVVIRQLPSQGLSFQLWPAATTLVSLLDRHVISVLPTANRRLRILELGSGTGLVGIVASAVLGADVTVTDLPHVLPNLRFNVEANSGLLAVQNGTVDVAALSWGESEDMERIGRDYDLVLGSDVVYHDHLYEPLLKTLRFLFLGGECEEKEKKKVFVMGHLRRWKKEGAFFKKAKKHFEVEVIHEDGPSSESRTGVVVYRFAKKDAVFR